MSAYGRLQQGGIVLNPSNHVKEIFGRSAVSRNSKNTSLVNELWGCFNRYLLERGGQRPAGYGPERRDRQAALIEQFAAYPDHLRFVHAVDAGHHFIQ